MSVKRNVTVPLGSSAMVSGGRPGDVDEGALELELVRQARAALDRDLEPGEADERRAQLVVRKRLRLCVGLADRELALAKALGRLGRRDSLGRERAAGADQPDVLGDRPDEAGHRAALLERRLAGGEDARDVPPAPGVGQRPRRQLAAGCDEELDVAFTDLGAGSPDRQLLGLARELLRIVADELDERTARGRVGVRLEPLELLGDPARKIAPGDVVDE